MSSKGYLTQCWNARNGCPKTTHLAAPLKQGQRGYCGDCKADPAKSPEETTKPIYPSFWLPICVGQPYDLAIEKKRTGL